jgi:hypothetical protein
MGIESARCVLLEDDTEFDRGVRVRLRAVSGQAISFATAGRAGSVDVLQRRHPGR